MTSKHQPSPPRLSASLIVIDGKNRVLMVERNPNSRSFAGAYVFPGGNYDPQQDAPSNMRLTAIRETFEESGVLLVTNTSSLPSPTQAALEAARESIHAQRKTFTSFLADNKLTPNVDSLLPFTQWITPPTIPRRFHTHFFVTFIPASSIDLPADHGLRHLPTPDGGIEVISVRFLKPQDAISEFKAEKIALMPPQFYLLSTLASILQGDGTTVEQMNTIRRLACSSFGGYVINPRPLPEKDEEGLTVLTYEGDESRGGKPGARHRARVRSRKGVMHVVQLERNIDVFADLPAQLGISKL
ncbi:NUDIX domain-containing protein [Gautieria morchelliformis]|nr:NUDIX domain-containing protein [Gautieria morchelliformis]